MTIVVNIMTMMDCSDINIKSDMLTPVIIFMVMMKMMIMMMMTVLVNITMIDMQIMPNMAQIVKIMITIRLPLL
jgi:hypothetical protein